MNRGNLFILITGSFFILAQYRKKISKPTATLRLWAEYKGTLIGEEASKECEEAQLRIRSTRIIFIIFELSLIISLANWQFNFLPGPVLLLIVGIAISISLLNESQISLDVNYRYNKDSEERTHILNKKKEKRNGFIKILITIVFISGFWSYRIQQDGNEQKQYAINQALDLSDTGWCSNWWDIDASGGVDNVVKTGGWPCIYINSISNITFSNKSDYQIICFNYVLTRSNGVPTEDNYVKYDFGELCSSDSWFIEDGGWNTSSFQDKIYQRIKPDLDKFQVFACNQFNYRLTEQEKIVYC